MTAPTTPPRPRRLRAGQRGFVASAAQVTLILTSLVVSATALSLGEVRDRAAEQAAHVHASYLLKAGSSLQSALDRAVADSAISRRDASVWVRFEDGTSDGSRIRLFDEDLGYGSQPRWPTGLLVEDDPHAGRPRWSGEMSGVIEVTGVDLGVCRRFNELTQGTDPEAAPPSDIATALAGQGWQQGCVAAPGATAGVWFMRAFATELCRGSRCRAGDVVGASVRRGLAVDVG